MFPDGIKALTIIRRFYTHARIESSAANTREVVEMTRPKAKGAYAHIKEVIDTYRPGKAA